ncbi:MAG: PKD domain-containing protein, partial [Candidatus Woesearchaeota archaeon]
DGQTLINGPNIQHTYNIGTFYPTVKATNGNITLQKNCPTITATQQTTPLNGTCNAQPTTGNIPLKVNFTGTATGGTGTYNYQWTFGDGTTGSGQQTTHTYNQTGTYNPKLKITDTNNNQITINCPTITATQTTPIINYTLTCEAHPTNGYAPLKVNFNATIKSNNPENTNYAPSTTWTYTWTFGDGQTLINGPNIQHTYNIGTFYPTVKATNGNITLQKNCPTITARKPIELKCIANPTIGNVPLGVNFEALTYYMKPGNDFVMFEWDFGDENIIITQSSRIKHSYFIAGQYTPKLKGIKFNGEVVYAECPKIIALNNNYLLKADPNGPYKGFVNTPLLFDASKSKGDIVKYVWDFGDGTLEESFEPYIYHTYFNKIGRFNVKLTIYDLYGNSDTAFTTAIIIEPTNFTREEDKIKEGLWIGRIDIYGRKGIEEVAENTDEIMFVIDMENFYDYSLKDARITIEIADLGIKQKSSVFNLKKGQKITKSMIVPIYNAPNGLYNVKIIVADDNVRRVKYRELFIGKYK